jgi:hypothetical protein
MLTPAFGANLYGAKVVHVGAKEKQLRSNLGEFGAIALGADLTSARVAWCQPASRLLFLGANLKTLAPSFFKKTPGLDSELVLPEGRDEALVLSKVHIKKYVSRIVGCFKAWWRIYRSPTVE